MDKSVKYLIIGNSAGGIGAAEAIRQVDSQGSLAIVSDEPYPAYSRPMISDYLAGKCTLEKMLFRPAGFYESNNIITLFDSPVQRLDVSGRIAQLRSGEQISWEKLLLATGGSPIVPRIKGKRSKGIFTFTTLDDARKIDQYLKNNQVSEVVVIGGGLIGVSAAEALVKRGLKVTIVEMKDRILNVMLDSEASALEAGALTRAGVNIRTGRTVEEVNSYAGETVASVTLDNSGVIPCEMVIVAIGVRPRAELAAGAGIQVDRGIVVDRRMATSIPEVYACGDVAEAYDFVYRQRRLTPIWPNAYQGGMVAGANMAGKPAEYQGGTAMNSLKYFGLDILSAGMPDAVDGCEAISGAGDGYYHKVVLRDGVVVGMIFAGNIEKAGIVYSLMRKGVRVERFKQALVAADFGLASLPGEIWRPRLERPAVGVVSAVTAVEAPEEFEGAD
ncbi:MAG: NAD(P)/FAD-dependent oxidoreductase [Chloroflexi bacterium]|nr:NAD(P)/FAD-dependent oxidoreductase [Chloroflexota bacterium]